MSPDFRTLVATLLVAVSSFACSDDASMDSMQTPEPRNQASTKQKTEKKKSKAPAEANEKVEKEPTSAQVEVKSEVDDKQVQPDPPVEAVVNTPVPSPTPSASMEPKKPTQEELALTAFMDVVGPAAKSSCSGCHRNTNIAGAKLSATDDAVNRVTLRGFVYDANTKTCNSTLLVNKINGTSSHRGGNLIAQMPATKIQTWVNAEPLCQPQTAGVATD